MSVVASWFLNFEVFFAALKKRFSPQSEGKPAFETIVIEMYKQGINQKKQTNKKRKNGNDIRMVISSISVGVIAKIDDENYVLST